MLLKDLQKRIEHNDIYTDDKHYDSVKHSNDNLYPIHVYLKLYSPYVEKNIDDLTMLHLLNKYAVDYTETISYNEGIQN